MINISKKSKCSGCHACANACPKSCIKMINDREGFWYPEVDKDKCIKCGFCEKVCPIFNKKEINNTPIAYAAYNKDEKIRMESSSGGLFTILAEKIIANNGVVFGACFNEKFEVIHDYVEKTEDVYKFRGSKYVQSKIGNTYKQSKQFLEKGRIVLFSGTPCQIGGLKSYLRKEYNNLYCQDIICHGVPSPKVWRKYVAYREKCAGVPARRIAFRRKYEGWKRYSVSFLFNNDTEYHQTLDKDLMMIAFLRNACLRPLCYDCSFKTINRQSDITLADFWGIQNVMPEMDDDKGTSLLVLNSDKGKELFDSIKEQIEFKVADLNEAIKYNPSMISSVTHNQKRQGFFNDLDTLEFDRLVKKHCTDGYVFRCKRKLRRVLSKIKHFIFK